MKKTRIPIPKDISTDILFRSDRTCAVCNTPGKPVQIHHIDEDPANNDLDNLAVLCLDCHDQTMTTGGFGQKLDAQLVRKYRNAWYQRIEERNSKVDQHHIAERITSISQPQANALIKTDLLEEDDDQMLTICRLLNNLPALEDAQNKLAHIRYSDGTTLAMNQSNGHMISFYEEILLDLAKYYPKDHFHVAGNKIFFRKIISERFIYHRLVLETHGIGTGGSILSVNSSAQVAYDIKRMIADLADALTYYHQIEQRVNLDAWRNKWLYNQG